jgi:hypothetical protein
MFCPTCGRENPNERKFCSSCGTNLEAVSQVLSGVTTNIFTRLDTGLDQLIARYSEHVFKDAPSNATDRSVGNSWKLLGKGVMTSFVDLLLSLIIWNVFTLRFQILLFSTPFRLLSQRARQKKPGTGPEKYTQPKLPEPPEQRWLPGEMISVSEHTTEIFQSDPESSDRKG